MLYQMVTAYFPTTIKKYKYGTGEIPFRNIDWKHLENEGFLVKDLIIKCLQMNPKDRITAKDALKHQWFDNLNNLTNSTKIETIKIEEEDDGDYFK